jgi:uncharacterized membrane protein
MCPPKGVPNVLIILLDDVDCSATSAFGEPRHRNHDVDIPPSPEEAEQKTRGLAKSWTAEGLVCRHRGGHSGPGNEGAADVTEAGAESGMVEVIQKLIELAAFGIEVLAVAVILAAVIVVAVSRGTMRDLFRPGTQSAYESYKLRLGKALLLGLEFLVAADVVRTVTLQPTLNNVAVLGLLVFIRTFLSWSLVVETEGRWPWHAKAETHGRGASEQAGDRAPDA